MRRLRTRVGSSPAHTSGRKTRIEKFVQRVSVDLVGLGLGAGDRSHRFGVRQHNPLHIRLEDADDGQSVSGDLQTYVIVWGKALGEHLKVLDVRRDARAVADLAPSEMATSQKSTMTRDMCPAWRAT